MARLMTMKVYVSNAQLMQKTNPKYSSTVRDSSSVIYRSPRYNVAPYNDVRVRQAIQMAIDLPTIAATFYGGTIDPTPSTITSNYMTGGGSLTISGRKT